MNAPTPARNGMAGMNSFETLCSNARRFWADERGATAIEYAMIAAGIGAALAATITSLGSQVKTTLYDKLANLL
jgi:pilus assembly protein Flp/PilA